MTTTPPLPEPFDYCYEFDGPWGTRKFSPDAHNGRKPDRSVALFKASQVLEYGAPLLAEIERLTAELAEARAALEVARVDAERYLRVRDEGYWIVMNVIGGILKGKALDDAIDHTFIIDAAIDSARESTNG